jgi:hypothetical protein
MNLSVTELVERCGELDDALVTVDGFIFVHWNDDLHDEKYGDFYLAPSQDDFADKTRCVFLDFPDLYLVFRKRKIRMRAGGRNGGGIWDRCQARGRVAKSSIDPFPVALCELESLSIWRDPNKIGRPKAITF